MKIIYHCYGGTHTSILAASIHVGKLNKEILPDDKEINELKYFDDVSPKDYGKLHFIGVDKFGNEIYSCCMKKSASIVKKALKDILKIYNLQPEEIYFVSTLGLVTFSIRIGGFLSRHLGLIRLGRPMVIYGSRSNFYNIVNFVDQVKENIPKTKS